MNKKIKRKNMNLTSKLALVYILAGFLPVLIILAVNFFEMRSMFTDEEKRKNEVYIKQTVESMDSEFEEYNKIADYISKDGLILKNLSAGDAGTNAFYERYNNTVVPAIELFSEINPGVKSIMIYLDRNINSDMEYLAPISEIEDCPWYSEEHDNYKNNWYIDYDREKVFVVRSFKNENKNDFLGVIYMEMELSQIVNKFKNAGMFNYGIKIFDNNDEIMLEYDYFSEKNEKYIVSAEEFKSIENNKKYNVLTCESDAAGWKVRMYQPTRIIISKITPVNLITIIGIVTCMVAAFLCIRFNAVFVTGRIKKLQQVMDTVEEGNFLVEINNNNDDEIGLLVNSFSKMIAKLNHLINEVYKSKIKEKEYEMTALQAQINPHFLYNTLSMINWKAIEAGQPDISKITLSLSSFYRTSLNKGKSVIDLNGEIQNIRSYLDIQLMLHDDDFDVEMDVDEDTLKYTIPNLILQPLVENAIEHGIDIMPEGRGKVTVKCKDNGEFIDLSVIDNGVGMIPEQADAILTSDSKGYGVRNVNERIKLFYGAQYSIKVISKIGEGTEVLVRIPKKLEV